MVNKWWGLANLLIKARFKLSLRLDTCSEPSHRQQEAWLSCVVVEPLDHAESAQKKNTHI